MGKRRGQGEPREDQFGEYGGSQDKQNFSGFSSGKGLSGGGTAGGKKAGGDYTFQRQVPKFLQKYSHLLGKTAADEDEPVVEGGPDGKGAKHAAEEEEEEDEQQDNIEADALKRAMADNPELAAEFGGQLASKLRQAEAAEEKERGNALFSKKKYDEAIKCFSRCIELDPSCEVYWSNRSAACAALERWQEAMDDAKRVITLKPGWAKGWGRVGAAAMGLKLYGESKEAYERACQLEPADEGLRRGAEKAEMMEVRQIQEGKHTFKKLKSEGASGPSAARQAVPASRGAGAGASSAAASAAGGSGSQPRHNVNKKMLSFAGDEEEEG